MRVSIPALLMLVFVPPGAAFLREGIGWIEKLFRPAPAVPSWS